MAWCLDGSEFVVKRPGSAFAPSCVVADGGQFWGAHTGLLWGQSLTALPQGPTTDRQNQHLGPEQLEFGCRLPPATLAQPPHHQHGGFQGLGCHHFHGKLSMTQMEEPLARPSAAK